MKNLAITVVSLMAITSFGDTFYVDGSVEASGDGSQRSPVKTVAEGVALAVNDGDIVEISEKGSPYPVSAALVINRAITLVGATGNPDDVVLDGSSQYNVLDLQAAAKVFSLTVKGGRAIGGNATVSRGGGITLAVAGGVVSNCVVRGCVASSNSGKCGIYMSGDALVIHTKIWGNSATAGNGAGAGVSMKAGQLVDCLIISNKVKSVTGISGAQGGGVYCDNGGTIRNCTIADNSGNHGGGVYFKVGANPRLRIFNTLICRNTSLDGSPNLEVSNAGSSFKELPSHCASSDVSKSVCGEGYIDLEGFDPLGEGYLLSAAGGDILATEGDPGLVGSTIDFFGTPRPTDDEGNVLSTAIGCAQYVASTKKSVKFQASPLNGVDAVEVTFVALPDGGLDLTQCECAWYLNGELVPGEAGATLTKTLPVGFYSAKFTAKDSDGKVYEYEEGDPRYIVISPSNLYVAPGSDGEAPYDRPEKASSNLLDVADAYLQSGVTLHVAAGQYPLVRSLKVTDGVRVIGDGRDRTILYATRTGTSIVEMHGEGAFVDGVCLSNSVNATGLEITGKGGHFTRGSIVKCQGIMNQSGGGARIYGTKSRVSCTIISGNRTYSVSGNDSKYTGGGVHIKGGILEDSLIISNKSCNAAGVHLEGGILRNCTVIGNQATTTERLSEKCIGVGGVYGVSFAVDGTCFVVNCIVRGNTDGLAQSPSDASNDVGGTQGCFDHNCIPASFGGACVTEDPQFKDAVNGDYRIGGSSPCAYAGVYQSWMDGATDFFGNPRTTPGKKVSIGYCQAPGPGLMLLVR